MPKYICGATSDIGVGREQQEDFVQFCELDEKHCCASLRMEQVLCRSDRNQHLLLLWT